MQLSAQKIAQLGETGFVPVEQISDDQEVCQIRHMAEDLLAKKAGLREGAFFDMLAPTGTQSEMKLVQIKNASAYAPGLSKTRFLRNAKELARQILGPEATLWFDMLIVKPAKSATSTPWHQDEAFCDPRFEHNEITFWMPLQDTTVENGCMSFIPGSHKRTVLSHRSPGDDPTVHALECCGEFEPGEAVACALPAGCCSIHYGRTLHTAGGSQSDQPRYAYILGFHVPPTPIAEERSFPWLAEKRTDDSALAKSLDASRRNRFDRDPKIASR